MHHTHVPFQDSFILYKETPGAYVILADKSRVPCNGVETVCFLLSGKKVIFSDVLHVPCLRSPLLSVRCFRRILGCSFIADNHGSYLTFPSFILNVDDSSDCTILSSPSPDCDFPDFDSRLFGSISAVSDNTHFKDHRRPIGIKQIPRTKTTRSSNKNTIINTDDTFPGTSTVNNNQTASLSLTASNNNNLEHIDECNNNNDLHLLQPPDLDSTIHDLGLNPSDFTSPTLSAKQIQEVTTAIISHLQKYRCITPELLNFIRDKKYSTKNATSTTPDDRPTLLSSDKASNTFPSHIRFTIQQLSRYFGFRSLKNWDSLHDICQPNLSFINSSDPPLELGHAANIKKARSNKTPIDRPKDFLDVVHCDIGYGNTKSIGNGAQWLPTSVIH
jgi:hypothetical protein